MRFSTFLYFFTVVASVSAIVIPRRVHHAHQQPHTPSHSNHDNVNVYVFASQVTTPEIHSRFLVALNRSSKGVSMLNSPSGSYNVVQSSSTPVGAAANHLALQETLRRVHQDGTATPPTRALESGGSQAPLITARLRLHSRPKSHSVTLLGSTSMISTFTVKSARRLRRNT